MKISKFVDDNLTNLEHFFKSKNLKNVWTNKKIFVIKISRKYFEYSFIHVRNKINFSQNSQGPPFSHSSSIWIYSFQGILTTFVHLREYFFGTCLFVYTVSVFLPRRRKFNKISCKRLVRLFIWMYINMFMCLCVHIVLIFLCRRWKSSEKMLRE